jgi:hypothetical protein
LSVTAGTNPPNGRIRGKATPMGWPHSPFKLN